MDPTKRNRFEVNPVNDSSAPPIIPQPVLMGYTKDDDMNPEGLYSVTNNEKNDEGHTWSKISALSFRRLTKDALPIMDNYRNMMSITAAYRPTLDDLHDVTMNGDSPDIERFGPNRGNGPDEAVKFGWVKGVFVRCLLCIWGVMLFLRLSWVSGQAGIGQAWLIILLATAVTGITGISMSAISTNGLVKGGPEIGASIGAIFATANAIAAAMYVVGFAEAMVDLLTSLGTYVVPDPTNSVRIIGTITVIVLTGIICVGMEWEASAQVVLLIILLAAMLDFVIGSLIGPLDDEEYSKGFVGYNGSILLTNLVPDYRITKEGPQSFFSVFSIFFPAATGILAGANISGDLADPQLAIPRGTLLAIFVTTISYLGFALIAGACVVRDATGNFTLPDYLVNSSDFERRAYISHGFESCQFGEDENGTVVQGCAWGLMNSFQVMELVSIWGPLIYAGCFSATLSSALASLVSAPKVFQALCNDGIYPYIEFFGKGYGKNNEPVRGYILTFFVALAFVLIAELNAIAPLISNFFLAAYALINFSTFHVDLVKPVGWRPTFRFYNAWVSLAGGILCVAVMFLIHWVTALCTFAVIVVLCFVVIYRKPVINWGSSAQSQTYKDALAKVHQLEGTEDHVKNYTPQILLLTGDPTTRPTLIDFAFLITKNISLLLCAEISADPLPNKQRKELASRANKFLKAKKVKAFYNLVDGVSFQEGAAALFQSTGIGKLKPNVVMMGFKGNWESCPDHELLEYFATIHKALDLHIGLTILRVQSVMGALDYGEKIAFSETNNDGSDNNRNEGNLFKNMDGGQLPQSMVDALNIFRKTRKDGIIDVWWTFDDGGLTLLLPHLINTRKKWANCKLRVFALANNKHKVDHELRSMAELLGKFRIDYGALEIISDYSIPPQAGTKALFDSIIAPFRSKIGGTCEISDDDMDAFRHKSNRQMRLRELLQETSKTADLVVMTLPIPKKDAVPAPLYMTWLELLTRDMPPFLLVRGNQTSVLTFYS